MHPVFHEGLFAREALALGDLVLVVREYQVGPAPVYVQRLAQVLQRHGGTLDMPARPALAPGRIPRRLARLGALPDDEVHGVFLLVARLDARPGHHLVERAVRQLAVVVQLRNAEIDAALRRIGVALVHQPLHHLDYLGYLLRGARIHIHAADVQGVHVLHERVHVLFGQFPDADAQHGGLVDYLVVDIGEVLHALHFIAAELQIAADGIEVDVAHGVADVRLGLRRDAADVHLDLFALRDELFFLA